MNVRDQIRALMPDMVGGLRALAREHAPEVAAREAGYTIRNATSDEAVIRIYDEIWWLGVNAQDFVNDLDTITAPSMRVEINSPGGDLFDGITIYNALRNHPAYVTTRVDGIAASIASVIAQAGDKRIIQPSAQMMIHNAHAIVAGNTHDHAEVANILKQQDAVIAGIYASRSGKDAAGFRALMDAETWLTADMAVAEGLADVIVDPAAKTEPTARATLLTEISDAVDAATSAIASAERVDALRADAGKELSNSNRESLVGLRDALTRLDALLPQERGDRAAGVWTEDQVAELRARLASRAA